MDNQTAITLKPKLGYWVSKYFVIIVVASLLPFSAIYWDLEMPVHYALMVLFLVVWIMLCYTYIDTLFATKWIIISGDASDPILYMYGIDRNIPIIDTLRDRVKIARKESGIFEVANRS